MKSRDILKNFVSENSLKEWDKFCKILDEDKNLDEYNRLSHSWNTFFLMNIMFDIRLIREVLENKK